MSLSDVTPEKIAIIAANGFDEKTMSVVQKTLTAQGINSRVISVDSNLIMGWADENWGHHYAVDHILSKALASDYDAVIVPGGVRSLEKLALTAHTKRFIRGFFTTRKPCILLNEASKMVENWEMDLSDETTWVSLLNTNDLSDEALVQVILSTLGIEDVTQTLAA